MNQSQIEDILFHLSRLENEHSKDNGDHDHDGGGDDGDDLSAVNIAKATAMVVLFTASTLCGSIPFLLNRWFKWTENNTNARSATIVKCLLYFGGGVLLCTTFLHLLPEVNENIEELQKDQSLPLLSFHLAELLTCLGFFAMFFVEECIHAYIHRHQKSLGEDSAPAAFQRGRSIRDSFLVKGRKKMSSTSNDDDNGQIITSKSGGLSVQDLITNDIENQKYQEQGSPEMVKRMSQPQKEVVPNNNNNNNNTHVANNHNQHHNHDFHHGHSHLPTNIDEDMIVSSLRGLLVVLALSLHELFEGLAVGLESSAGNVWYMFGAVSAHKLVLAFCVGVELIVTRTRLWLAIVYVVTFAIVSPIGIGIGILVSNENSTASAIPSAILQGLATGTLLYVVFFEILSKERSGLVAYLAFVTGFLVMFGLQFASGHHSHSHGGHEHSHEHNEHEEHDHDHDHGHDHMTKTIDEQLRMLRDAFEGLNQAVASRRLN